MNVLRKVIGIFLALVLSALVAPGMAVAQSKIFSLNMAYESPDNAGYFRAVFKNETPSGNSTINSINLYAPSGATITDVRLQTQQVNTSRVITGNKVAISNMPGIPSKGGTWWVDVKLATTPACSTWNAETFAGNSFSQPFELQTNLSRLTIGGVSPGCTVKVDLSPLNVDQNATAVAMTATFTSNGAQFRSLTLPVPANLTLKTQPTITSPSGTTGTVTWSGTSFKVENLVPAGSATTPLVLSFTVDVAPACSAQTLTWIPVVYAGSSATGTSLGIDSSSQLAGSIRPITCAVQLSPTTITSASATNPLPSITVTLSGGSGSSPINVTSNCLLGGTTTGTVSGGTGTFSGLSFEQTGSCSLTFTATGPEYNGASGTYSGITVYPFGNLACGASLDLDATNPANLPNTVPGWSTGSRGAFNSKGDECKLVNYTVKNNILADNTFGLVWDTALQPQAAFALSANLKLVDVSATTGLPELKKPKMGWKYSAPDVPVFISGISCLAPIAPAPYGKLFSDAAANAASITVTSVTGAIATPPVPFPIYIGGNRRVVSSVAGNVWTLAAGTSAAQLAGTFVLSPQGPGLPASYGTVGTLISIGNTTTCPTPASCATLAIVGTPAFPTRDLPPAPFPIQVKGERMLVTKVNSQTSVEVSRGNGLTPLSALVGDPIVSTPMPLMPASAIGSATLYYTQGTPAQMCINTYGRTSVGINPSTGLQQVMPIVGWYDLGDGWIGTEDQ